MKLCSSCFKSGFLAGFIQGFGLCYLENLQPGKSLEHTMINKQNVFANKTLYQKEQYTNNF